MHPPQVVAAALHLLENGETPGAVSRQLGVPARTVREWHQGRVPRCDPTFDRDRLCSPPYAYLLGLYLGDGWIARMGRTFSLRVALDDRYPGIIASAVAAMSAIHPRGRVRVVSRVGCSVVSSYWNEWPTALPQLGSGRKHRRLIQLAEWQRAITTRFPRELVRGLIHSDGCRFVANQRVGSKTYSYARYSFSNRRSSASTLICSRSGGHGRTHGRSPSIAGARSRSSMRSWDRSASRNWAATLRITQLSRRP